MVLRFFLLAAIFLFASCVSIERNNPDDPGSANYNMGDVTPSSSSESKVVYGSPVTYEGETYQTVVIGTQTWLKRNLNYAVEGSLCYDNREANCTTYGRLYNWATAMALPSSCNTNDCASQVDAKHKGICPSGWHIPSKAEWTTLTNFVGDDAAKNLKATYGWGEDIEGFPDDGIDTYGFSALPGGAYSGSYFGSVGFEGQWWSSSILRFPNEVYNKVDNLSILSGKVFLSWAYSIEDFYSVRCIKN